jgi:glycosyltransferase involved in cell wall biosynthesis
MTTHAKSDVSPDKGQIEVSVIIPVYNDAVRLQRCLAALSRQTFDRTRFEVLVIDNGSADDPACVVAAYSFARMLTEPTPGSYLARNRGVSAAHGMTIVFTDSDCIPEEDWLKQGLRCLDANPGAGLVAGEIELFPRDNAHPTGVELYELAHGFPQRRYALELGFGATANVFTRRSVIDHVGAFDPALRSGGDKEWGSRVSRAGYDIVYCPAARVRHPARGSWSEHYRKLRRTIAGYTERQKAVGYPRSKFAKELGRSLVPPVGAVVRASLDPRMPGLHRKVKYISVVFGTRYIGAYLRLRCWIGSVDFR